MVPRRRRRTSSGRRRRPESNWCTRLCRPLPNHSATAPEGRMVSALPGYPKVAMTQQSLLDETAAPLIPTRPSLKKLKEAAAGCKACPLWKTGTQTVFGEGSPKSAVMFVGEQPGDQEDRAGAPFVGPAGRLLDEALADAGIDRAEVYVTNAVKHFRFERQGNRRLHKAPAVGHVRACRPWFDE